MGAYGDQRMAADRAAGQKLMDTIWRERNRYVVRTGKRPSHLTMCHADIWKLWVALGETVGFYRPDQQFMGMTINLINELPEGVVVVS